MVDNVLSRLAIAITTDGVIKSTDELEKLTVAAKQTEVQASKTAKGIKSTGASANVVKGNFGAMKGATQNLSYQLQDVAVQAQMGTSAFIILGQQGPQIASIFGPGGAVVGTLIAFGSMLAGVLYNSFGTAESGSESLEEALTRLDGQVIRNTGGVLEFSRKLEELGRISSAAAAAQIVSGMTDARTAIAGSASAIDGLVEGITGIDLAKVNADIERLRKEGFTDRDFAAPVESYVTAISDVTPALQEISTALGISREDALAFAQAAGSLNSQDITTYSSLRNVVDEITKSQRGLSPAMANLFRDMTKNDGVIRDASESLKFFKQNLREVLAGGTLVGKIEGDAEARVKSLGESVDEEEKELARRQKAFADADSAILRAGFNAQEAEDRNKARLEVEKAAAKTRLDSIMIAGATEFEAIKMIEDQKIAKLKEDRANKLISATEFEAAKTQIEKTAADERAAYTMATEQMALQTAATFAGKITGLMSSAFGEQSAAAKAAFVVQQGIAIAQTIVATEMAAIAAAAQTAVLGGPLAFFASAAGIRAMGYASVGIIAGQTVAQVAGGRALGGQVRGGESYLVGERGPELLTMGTSGRIATNENLKNAVGGGGGVSIVNNVDARGSGPDVESKIRTAMEQTSAQTIATIQDLMRRRRFV